MKSVMKSIYVKIIAVVIFMSCFGAGTFILTDAVVDLNISDGYHYNFEKYFKDSNMIREPIEAVFRYLILWANGEQTEEQTLKNLKNYDYVYYIAEINGNAFSNIPDSSDSDFENDYSLVVKQKDETLTVERESNYPYYLSDEFPKSDFIIRISLSKDYVEQSAESWYREQKQLEEYIWIITGLSLLAFLMLVYLLWVCGLTNNDDKIKLILIDRMYIEITSVIFFIILLFAVYVPFGFIETIASGLTPLYSMMTAVSALTALLSGIALAFLLSIIRNLKNKTFKERCLIWRIIRKIIKSIKYLKSGIVKGLSYKTSAILIAAAAVYTACVFIFTILIENNFGFAFILIVGVFLIACVLIAKGTEDFDKILTGINEIKNGNTEYKIENIHIEILKDMADSINTVGDGISKSVEQKIKAERMKSELITNVSHDLKTPLTSIISYADILCKEELKPDEANDYARVIKEKSEQLKNLTADLFDISKVQSGNETIEKEELDIALLINQSVGEADSYIKDSELEFVINIPDEAVTVTGDGKKLSRVFENLVMNAVKYSMKKTRVYIDVKKQSGKCVIEMKNISAYPLNFDCEEITERFVRGDLSRSTEGSGLGLAIAKSYVEACGGSFSIITDGDLFKAVIEI